MDRTKCFYRMLSRAHRGLTTTETFDDVVEVTARPKVDSFNFSTPKKDGFVVSGKDGGGVRMIWARDEEHAKKIWAQRMGVPIEEAKVV